MIPVTKPFLPPKKTYYQYLDRVYDSNILTNSGPLYHELTEKLQEYLGIDNLLLVSNGTIALQVATRALGLEHGANCLTTPFTFAATMGANAWQGLNQSFVDIDTIQWNLDVNQIRPDNMKNIDAIMAVHVFGSPSSRSLVQIAEQYDSKLIFDAAHAFAVENEKRSILKMGDASTLSFHATKLFHTVEGGGIVFKDNDKFEEAKSLINFGLNPQGIPEKVGVNGKLSEVHCAMGLAVLEHIDEIMDKRLTLKTLYQQLLRDAVILQGWQDADNDNASYMPILLKNQQELFNVKSALENNNIFPRRYFYPSLHDLPCYGSYPTNECPVSVDIASRVLCLPLYVQLDLEDVKRICAIVLQAIDSR